MLFRTEPLSISWYTTDFRNRGSLLYTPLEKGQFYIVKSDPKLGVVFELIPSSMI